MLKKIPDKMEYWQYSTVNPPTLGEGRGAGGRGGGGGGGGVMYTPCALYSINLQATYIWKFLTFQLLFRIKKNPKFSFTLSQEPFWDTQYKTKLKNSSYKPYLK